jgi:hypothetical protein
LKIFFAGCTIHNDTANSAETFSTMYVNDITECYNKFIESGIATAFAYNEYAKYCGLFDTVKDISFFSGVILCF